MCGTWRGPSCNGCATQQSTPWCIPSISCKFTVCKPLLLYCVGLIVLEVQTQEGFPLVTGDQESTKDVHVFSRSWALQGDGYTPHFFDNGR